MTVCAEEPQAITKPPTTKVRWTIAYRIFRISLWQDAIFGPNVHRRRQHRVIKEK
jgi:hypothetical protein